MAIEANIICHLANYGKLFSTKEEDIKEQTTENVSKDISYDKEKERKIAFIVITIFIIFLLITFIIFISAINQIF